MHEYQQFPITKCYTALAFGPKYNAKRNFKTCASGLYWETMWLRPTRLNCDWQIYCNQILSIPHVVLMMNDNPYQPPMIQVVHAGSNPLWKSAARFLIVLYGFVFIAMVVNGQFEASLEFTWRNALWRLTANSLDALTSYGIFALAFRSIRLPSLYRIWRVLVWILPIFSVGEAVWELSHPDSLDAEGAFLLLAFGLPVVLVVLAPSLAFNFMLVSRLRSLYEQKRDQEPGRKGG